ncbi:MAG: manganese efflux pump MntP family protein [Candidatus Riflebacteria bacterium]|nr:manganese efflux pump MntP family protein [Candidatus Riflebacteria bacterium]
MLEFALKKGDFMLEKIIFGIGAGFALGCDAFAVGMALGTCNPDKRGRIRVWVSFGLFQFFMPIIGWFVGKSIYEIIKNYDHWLACGLMAIIATNMLIESLKNECENDEVCRKDQTKGLALLGLSVATSIDALGVGFGMGIAKMEPFLISVIIGIMASLMTYTGLKLGKKLSCHFGKRVETAGAIVLYIIAWRLSYI